MGDTSKPVSGLTSLEQIPVCKQDPSLERLTLRMDLTNQLEPAMFPAGEKELPKGHIDPDLAGLKKTEWKLADQHYKNICRVPTRDKQTGNYALFATTTPGNGATIEDKFPQCDPYGGSVKFNLPTPLSTAAVEYLANIAPDAVDDPWVRIVIPHELTHLVFDTAVSTRR